MFTISMIATVIAVMLLATMSFFGIYKYKDTTEDEDAEKTVIDLKRILLGLIVVIITSLGIMGYIHYTEKPNVQPVQVEAK